MTTTMMRRERGILEPSHSVAWRPQLARLRDGTRLRIFETGRDDAGAPVVVALHGLGHWTQAAWNRIVPEFSSSHRIVAFDLPGFGASDKPDASYSLAYFTSALRAVVATLGVVRFGLIGHSYGGLIAANYAAYHPDRVRALGLIDPAGFTRTLRLAARVAACTLVARLPFALKAPESAVLRNLRNATFDAKTMTPDETVRACELARDPAFTRTFLRVYAAAANDLVHHRRLMRRFAGYGGPVTLIWGRQDRYVPIRAVHAAKRVYPQADALLIDRCGHCPAIEHPALVARALLAIGI